MRTFDLISMGRTIVDVYGNQVGCGLEETSSFSKYVGGCPANVAIGAARLGLRVAHITRVGDDHHGRFLRDQLSREGIDVSHIKTDTERLTGVVFLGIRDQDTFPLLHYRDDCADMAISAEDYSREFVCSATALLVTGSHITTEKAAANVDAAIAYAKASDTRVIFDIDYRPVFWRLVAKDAGESRYVSSGLATSATQHVLPSADLIVGTEEEIRIAGGDMDTREALENIRRLSAAPIVMKRGPLGCVVFDGAIPGDLDQGILGPGFPVEIFNIVGAGDGFLSGFLSGWLRDANWQECCRRGNACGAIVVSRHGCSPASPTDKELVWYLENATDQKHRMIIPSLKVFIARQRAAPGGFLFLWSIARRPVSTPNRARVLRRSRPKLCFAR
jgi:5-dehydro-2-deoxygluconokinase